VSASGNQVLTYSLTSGEQKGHFFGTRPLLSSASGLVAEGPTPLAVCKPNWTN
jgi:hypothetical protein